MTPILYHNNEDCCGCKACANACPRDAISFQVDEYGFWYPIIDDEKCIGCEKCVKTCDFQKKEEFGHTPIEGLAVRHKDKAVYHDSTSGGVFTAISEWVFAKGGAVFGCSYDDELRPIHKMAENKEQLKAMRGSKYVQSDIGFIYREVRERLKESRYVFFTGTPCQIAGLYSFLGNTNTEHLLTADLVCHGVPNQEVFRKYIRFLEKKHHGKITDFKFRDKSFGWERPVLSIVFDNGGYKWWFSTTDVYYQNFIKGNLQRPSCFQCKYACSFRTGDITIGDFWGYEKANLKMSVREGVSCCLINTEKARNIIEELNVNSENVEPEIIIKGNAHLRKVSNKGKQWESVLNSIHNNGFNNIYSQFRKSNRKAFLKAFVKRIVLKPSKE